MTATLSLRDRHYDSTTLRAGVTIDDASDNERSAIAFCQAWLRGDTHFLLHTSGSTGTPKPIHLTRSQMEASARATIDAVGLTPQMRALVCLSTQYVAGTMMLVRGLTLGMEMTLIEPAANPLAHYANDFDFAAIVPMQMAAMLGAAESDRETLVRLNRTHALLIGGGALSVALEERIGGLEVACYHTYGMTETVSHVALRRLNGDARSELFTPLPGVEVMLDTRGCLGVRGGMTDGVWVQTNDLVELRADGRFRWLGRIDNVINTGGVKVSIETLERALEGVLARYFHGSAPRFVVAGIPDERLGQQVTLLLESPPLAAEQIVALLATLRNADLPRYSNPRVVRTVERFIETPTGKIDRAGTVALSHSN